MPYCTIDSIPVWGHPQKNAVAQAVRCAQSAARVALMADHHLGYSQPIGGVVAYRNAVSPSGVGYDIACGNKAVRLDLKAPRIQADLPQIMDTLQAELAFGVGRQNKEPVEHTLFDDDPAWDLPVAAALKDMARAQLGTIGSGNHYVDLFRDDDYTVWVGVHFGSRGLGHKLATHYIKAGGGKNGIDAAPTLLPVSSDLGQEYLTCMRLAGRYAYAGRDWVCQKVASLLGTTIVEEVHNHHNFAWEEEHDGELFWVVRKGATPAFPGQRGFVGGSMGDISVILRGKESDEAHASLYSTVHGAGRLMSRTQAAGKTRWKKGRPVRISAGKISRAMMLQWVEEQGVVLRGAGTDESPHCYKRITEVLDAHHDSVEIETVLHPIGVAMAGADEFDPYKD